MWWSADRGGSIGADKFPGLTAGHLTLDPLPIVFLNSFLNPSETTKLVYAKSNVGKIQPRVIHWKAMSSCFYFIPSVLPSSLSFFIHSVFLLPFSFQPFLLSPSFLLPYLVFSHSPFSWVSENIFPFNPSHKSNILRRRFMTVFESSSKFVKTLQDSFKNRAELFKTLSDVFIGVSRLFQIDF